MEDTTAENVAHHERQYRMLADMHEETSKSLEESTAREVNLRRERDAAVQARVELTARRDEALEGLSKVKAEFEQTKERLRDVERQSAALEIKNLEITKSQKKLEDDNAGLYMALEGKQQELILVSFIVTLLSNSRLCLTSDLVIDEAQIRCSRDGGRDSSFGQGERRECGNPKYHWLQEAYASSRKLQQLTRRDR